MFVSAPFCRPPAPRVANENSPHHLSSQRKKLGPILPIRFTLVDQSKINLVNQRRRLQSMAGPFPAEHADGLPMQFVINNGEQTFERIAVATFTSCEPLRDLRPGRHRCCPARRDPGLLRLIWLMGWFH